VEPGKPLPPFHEWLAQAVTRRAGETLTAAQLAALPIPDYLRMNVRVVGENDEIVAEGRDLLDVRREQREASSADDAAAGTSTHAPLHAEHREWDFGALPESLDVERNRLRFRVFPAVEDRGHGVETTEARTAFEAEAISRRGLTRLALLAAPQQAKFVSQRIGSNRDLVLLSSGLDLMQPLPQAITWRAARECFFPDSVPLPRTREAFDELIQSRRGDFADTADNLAAEIGGVLREWRQARTRRRQASTHSSPRCCRRTSSSPRRANGLRISRDT
jgi:ATP-dependent helicase HrpA